VLFTNTKPQSKEGNCVALSYYSAPAAPNGNREKARTAATPTDFPRVEGDEQKSRDGERRAILEKELTTEQTNLDQARQSLPTASAQDAKAQRDAITLHERNIKALQKELAGLR
jgi:hypothetical protein